MDRRKAIVSVVLTLLTLLIAGLVYNNFLAQKTSTVSDKKRKENIRSVRTSTFAPSKVNSVVSVDGRTTGFEQIELYGEVTGQLKRGKTFRKGSTFIKGEVLFEIDSEDDKYNLYAQRSALMNNITQIMPDLKFDYPAAFDKWNKYLQAFKVEQNLQPLPDTETQQEKYFITGKNIYNQYYSIKSLEDRFSKYKIRAPFSGVFLTINAFPGSLVSPGLPLGKIMNTSRYEIEAPIKMKDLAFVKRGQELTLHSDELDQSWKGTVNRISNQIDQSTQSIPVFIAVSGKGLRDGIYLKGNLEGAEIENVSTLPRDALVDQNFVYVVMDSMIRKTPIEIISRSENTVFAKGLNGNEQVVVQGTNSLYDGQKVGILNEES